MQRISMRTKKEESKFFLKEESKF